MAIPRGKLVDDSESGIYHCVSRCVRQSFLIVNHTPPASPLDAPLLPDNHRCEWFLDRLALLTGVFAIDCVSLAVMSNHLHLLLRTLPEVVDGWSDAEVAYRWRLLHPELAMRRAGCVAFDMPPQRDEVRRLLMNAAKVADCRSRLSSLSWFMKELKEWIARRANREDKRKGAFWEERFSSDRVLDEPGLLLCASYIDLNPVAARMADDPIRARFTSVEAHARRLDQRGCELWRRIAEAPDSAGRVESSDQIEAFVAQFDHAMLSPAMPSRREPHGGADGWRLEQEHHVRVDSGSANSMAADAAKAGETQAATATDELPSGPSHDNASAASGATRPRMPADGPPLEFTQRQPRHAPRRPPAVALCEVGQGDYFRRLRALAEFAHDRGDARREEKRAAGRAARRRRRGGARDAGGMEEPSAVVDPRTGPPAVEASLARAVDLAAISRMAVALTQESPGRATELLRAMLAAPREWGSAIGTPASLAAHALRRGVRGVVMSLRPQGHGAHPAAGSQRVDRPGGTNRRDGPAVQ